MSHVLAQERLSQRLSPSNRFAELGAKVVVWDINKEANDGVAAEIKGKGQTAFPYQCDCSKREEIYQTAAQVRIDMNSCNPL